MRILWDHPTRSLHSSTSCCENYGATIYYCDTTGGIYIAHSDLVEGLLVAVPARVASSTLGPMITITSCWEGKLILLLTTVPWLKMIEAHGFGVRQNNHARKISLVEISSSVRLHSKLKQKTHPWSTEGNGNCNKHCGASHQSCSRRKYTTYWKGKSSWYHQTKAYWMPKRKV